MPSDQELQKILEENNQLLRRIRRQMLTAQILGWLKFLIIIVPLVLAYFYLKPYYQDTIKFYRELLGGATPSGRINLLQELQGAISQPKQWVMTKWSQGFLSI